MIEHAGAHINRQNSYGMSPLHLAARGGHRALIHYLLSSGASNTATNNAGQSPVDSKRRRVRVHRTVLTASHCGAVAADASQIATFLSSQRTWRRPRQQSPGTARTGLKRRSPRRNRERREMRMFVRGTSAAANRLPSPGPGFSLSGYSRPRSCPTRPPSSSAGGLMGARHGARPLLRIGVPSELGSVEGQQPTPAKPATGRPSTAGVSRRERRFHSNPRRALSARPRR